MNKILMSGILLLGSIFPAAAQISIEDCYRKAQANYPLIRQYELIENTKEYNVANVAKGYLPQITLSAKASYQSDVTKLPFDLSKLGIAGVDIPTMSKDQYGATLDVNQTVWDGGKIKSQQDNARAQADVDKSNMDVTLYAVNQRVNQLFFGILLADEQLKLNQLFLDELQRNYERVNNCLRNGVANQADVDAVRVNQLKAQQMRVQYTAARKAYIEMLSRLIGEKIDEKSTLLKPVYQAAGTQDILRPELKLYDAQIRYFETKNNEIKSDLLPKLGVYLTGGYGRPGLNMLDDDFKAYYMAGIRLSWNFGNFYTSKNRRKLLQNSIKSVENQRETFLFNTNLDIDQKNTQIEKFAAQLKYDDEILRLRNAVKKASEAKMENGTISGTDLMTDVNAEQQAAQDKILHEIELLQTVYDMNFITNNK